MYETVDNDDVASLLRRKGDAGVRRVLLLAERHDSTQGFLYLLASPFLDSYLDIVGGHADPASILLWAYQRERFSVIREAVMGLVMWAEDMSDVPDISDGKREDLRAFLVRARACLLSLPDVDDK